MSSFRLARPGLAPKNTPSPACSSSKATPRCASANGTSATSPSFSRRNAGSTTTSACRTPTTWAAATPKATRPPLPLLRDAKVIEAPANQDTLTARYTQEAVKFITASKDRPFFLYFPHTAVHVPLHPGEKFKGKSANGTYGDWVEEVDWSVGRVLDTLHELKLAEHTLVLFTSDNGPWLTQGKNGGVAGPLRGGKGSTWEGGMREPTIAWWPGKIAPGTACDAPMSEIDVLPTLVKLAGGAVPADRKIDGKDIWPLLAGQSQGVAARSVVLFQGQQLEAVRSGPWKLAIAPQGRACRKADAQPAKHTGPRLYNLDTDIGETTDGCRGASRDRQAAGGLCRADGFRSRRSQEWPRRSSARPCAKSQAIAEAC